MKNEEKKTREKLNNRKHIFYREKKYIIEIYIHRIILILIFYTEYDIF